MLGLVVRIRQVEMNRFMPTHVVQVSGSSSIDRGTNDLLYGSLLVGLMRINPMLYFTIILKCITNYNRCLTWIHSWR